MLGAVPSLLGGHVRSWLVSLYGPSYLAVTCSLFGLTVDTCCVSLPRLLWEMTSWSFSYSAQCWVRQWLREMTSSAMLGSVLDTCTASVYGARDEAHFCLCGVWEMTSGLSPYSVLILVRQRIHVGRQSARLSGRGHAFLVVSGR